jgi:hypothetical protein
MGKQRCKDHEWQLIAKFSGWYLRCKSCGETTGGKSWFEPRPPGFDDPWTDEIEIPKRKK